MNQQKNFYFIHIFDAQKIGLFLEQQQIMQMDSKCQSHKESVITFSAISTETIASEEFYHLGKINANEIVLLHFLQQPRVSFKWSLDPR